MYDFKPLNALGNILKSFKMPAILSAGIIVASAIHSSSRAISRTTCFASSSLIISARIIHLRIYLFSEHKRSEERRVR